MSRKATILAGVGASLALAWLLLGNTFVSSSVCHHCGAVQSSRKWFVPGTSVCYFQSATVHPTSVSKVLESMGITRAHEHDWWFAHGSGNGIFCAIGKGRHLRGGVDSENVAALISAAHRFGETAFRDKVVNALLDPDKSLSVYHLGFKVTDESLTTAENFRAWLTEESAFFFEELAMAETE